MISRLSLLLPLILSMMPITSSGESTADPPPNIVVILADDMGFSDLGATGGEIPTPHIDSLAADGMMLTQFYNTARCCPTRASLLTGLWAHQAGVGRLTADAGPAHPGYRGFLNDRCVTIAEVLRSAGYRTIMTGKWHVGDERPHWPVDRGFERFYGVPAGGGLYFHPSKFLDRKVYRGDTQENPGAGWYSTDAFNDEAADFVEEAVAEKKPFFLYLAHIAPHYPLQAPPAAIGEQRGKYRAGWEKLRRQRHRRQIDRRLFEQPWALSPLDAPAWSGLSTEERAAADLRMAIYAAQVKIMDDGIGRLLDRIDRLGIRDNTLVVFLSDNGGEASEVNKAPAAPLGTNDSFASYGKSWANASNTPFRKYKKWVHEGGISTPLIARWPRVIARGGALAHQPAHVIDLMATCLEAAGIEYPATFAGKTIAPTEGISLLPVFRGGEFSGHETLYWEHEGHKAIRHGKWKAVTDGDGSWQLYDLETDRTEMNDLVRQFPAQRDELVALWQAWADRVGVEPKSQP